MPSDLDGQEASSLLPLHPLQPDGTHDDDDSDVDLFGEDYHGPSFEAIDERQPSRSRRLVARCLSFLSIFQRERSSPQPGSKHTRGRKRRIFSVVLTLLPIWIAIVIVFFPSYSQPPQRYYDLRKRAQGSYKPGRGNVNNEKVFIAASLNDPDGSIVNGAWGTAVAELVRLLDPKNVYLSVYENDASKEAVEALDKLRDRVECESQILHEPLDLKDLPRIIMPYGVRFLNRLDFLAKVRNRALAPLDGKSTAMKNTNFDKLLYINDIIFDPIDAANLLFSTNAGPDGKTEYRAACAMDFANPVKFYDTFATRDLEGYNMGVPFYPWFTSAGDGQSRKDVQAQKDAVRVKSCWGGMVAFNATYFQSKKVRFRTEDDPFWDSSECCLIHADIADIDPGDLLASTGIYMNPYVRVAYDERTFHRLNVAKRFERLYSPMQSIANYIAGRPLFNPRRAEEVGTTVSWQKWVSDEKTDSGSYQQVTSTVKPGGFCGEEKLLAIPESAWTNGHRGRWKDILPPPP